MKEMIEKFISGEDLDYFKENEYKIQSAKLYEKDKVLIIYSTSNDKIKAEDIEFMRRSISEVIQGFTVKIDNEIKFQVNKKQESEDNLYSNIKKDLIDDFNQLDESYFTSLDTIIDDEDNSFINEVAINVDEAEQKLKEKKLEKTDTKKVFFKKKSGFDDPIDIKKISEEDIFPTIEGEVFGVSINDTKDETFKIGKFSVYDSTDSILVTSFLRGDMINDFKDNIKEGVRIKLSGKYNYSKFDRDYVLQMNKYVILPKEVKQDMAKEKMVEIHTHTNMSLLSGSIKPDELIDLYKNMGHRGVFVTDLYGAQSFPDIMDLGDETFKIGYGIEALLYDDTEKFVQFYKEGFEDYVVFDIETTGLNPHQCEIIEIGAVKVSKGVIVDRYNQLIKPKNPIPELIVKLTGISQAMVEGKPSFEEIKDDFYNFIKGTILVAHNANFDIGFIKNKYEQGVIDNPFIDTLKLSRHVLPDLKNHKLDTITNRLNIRLVSHHRAVDDAEATAEIFIALMDMMLRNGEISSYKDLKDIVYSDLFTNWNTLIYAKNPTGLFNLYKIITKSHVESFYKKPRLRLSDLLEYKEGLIIGSEGMSGEIISYYESGFAITDLKEKLEKYDFCELQPLENYKIYTSRRFQGFGGVSDFLKKYSSELKEAGKKIIVGNNVFEMVKEDHILRKILAKSRNDFRAEDGAPLYARDTLETLEGLPYLTKEEAYEYTIKNTNDLLDQVETMRAIPRDKYPPIIEGSDKELSDACFEKAKEIYGEELPDIVEQRLNRELDSIIGNGYAVMYIIAKKLVEKSESDGYLVGSRGSVGSSFAATMSGITEVNPLPPHYICPNCKHSEFFTKGEYDVGVDMPEKVCPACGEMLKTEGFNIPFETFLGFNGDKEPDIDLNFAGEYQPVAHQYTEELFGNGYVFRAGTIATIQEKVGYGYVKNYLEERGLIVSNSEINRLVHKLVGIKRTTGQHPGGIMIVPKHKDIHDFSPVQYPADDSSTGVFTTHFAYKALHSNILKLDILGHDGPTMIRMLEDLTGIKSTDIKLDDPEVLKMFSSTEPLGISPSELGSKVSTYAIPEFGTNFVQNMLVETNPQYFSDLIRISGLSHGTDVWSKNAEDLINSKICTIKDVIATREDIMTYLLKAGLPNDFAFFTMEKVRKGKGLSEEDIKLMKEHGLPEWYIDSCKKIKYMFPKAHAVAYVMLSFRLAWYKLHYPREFYATTLSTKRADFDYPTATSGLETIKNKMKEIELLDKATVKEKNTYKVLEIVKEMYLRGYVCEQCDIYKSDAKKFVVTDKGIIPPLSCIPNLGDSVAEAIVEERECSKFTSQEDLIKRTKISKTSVSFMNDNNILKNLQKTEQFSFF